MLEQMRRQGASIFVYLIFCLLIAIFIINFRPGQSRSDDNGCSGRSNPILSVNGNEVTQTAYHISYSNPYNQGQQKQRVWVALETLIRRELLAQEGEARGLLVGDDLIDDQIKKGYFFLGGQRAHIPGAIQTVGDEKFYNHKAVKGWANQLNVSFNSYREEQKRALLATMMAETLADSVQVTRDEAEADYDYDHTLATYDVVTFKPDEYKTAMKISDADIDHYLASHGDAVQARYKADERTYKAVKRQLKLREIVIAKADDAAKAKLEAVRAGKQKFADAARELATEPALKASGGDIGWRTADNPMLGDKALSDAVKTLKPGEMTPVIATDAGAYLVIAEDQREGDLSFDQVKRELAEALAKDEWAKEGARRDAIKALTTAQGGKKLDQQFEREDGEPFEGPAELKKKIRSAEQMLEMQGLPDELRGQIQQQLQQLKMELKIQRQQILAAAEVYTKDQPAGWFADENGAGGGAAAGSAAGSAAAGPAPATPPAPPAPPAPPKDLMKPSTDTLPAFADIAHKVHKEGPAPRSHVMPGIGKSKEIADALFDQLAPGELPKTIYEVEGAYIVLQLVDRTKPDDKGFAKEADSDIAELRAERAQAVLDDWLRDRCETLAQKGRILPNAELLRETNDKGELVQSAYRPCISFH